MVQLDTSALIESLSGDLRALPRMRALIREGNELGISTLVLYEWRRGSRTNRELTLQQQYFPDAAAVPFGTEEAVLGASLYRRLPRARSREADIAIAACAIRHGARLWTLNPVDFADIPGLQLVRPAMA